MATRRGFRTLTIQRKETLSPHMLRVILTGDDEELDGFPEGQESANFKLVLPKAGQSEIPGPPWNDEDKPIIRTYTLRNYDAATREVSVDFVIFGEPGPGAQWASEAKVGDPVGFAGPGPAKLPDEDADWYLIGGDMSALPAASAILERLPKDAKGYAIFKVLSEEDMQELTMPAGMDVQWVIDPDPTTLAQSLIDAIDAAPWLDGSPAVWIAGEGGAMRTLRRIMKKERDVDRRRLYVSAYWEIGMNEDRHQVVKRAELEEGDAL